MNSVAECDEDKVFEKLIQLDEDKVIIHSERVSTAVLPFEGKTRRYGKVIFPLHLLNFI